MAPSSKTKKARSSTDDADDDFKATKLPIINTAASKRKQRRSSIKETIVDDAMDESDEPVSKRAKTKSNDEGDEEDEDVEDVEEVNNGMISIIPPDEVKIRQIQMTIILRPPPVNHLRLAQQIQESAAEIQEMIRVQCILVRKDNSPFIDAFLSSKSVMEHHVLTIKAIEDREVVLTGKYFLKEFKRLHPTTIRLAKQLKIVYITEDITMSEGEWKKKQDAHAKLMAEYNRYQKLLAAGMALAQYCPEVPPAPIRGRHKMYPMSEPRYGSGDCQVMRACRMFVNVETITIDLTSHVNYGGIDHGKFNTDHWYGERVAEHLYAAIGWKRHTFQFDTPAQARGENKLKKLTLVLGAKEVSKPEVEESTFFNSITAGFRGPEDAPNWQWLRYYFRQAKANGAVYPIYDPFVHTPLTVFKKDVDAGFVSYEREPPEVVEAADEQAMDEEA